MKKGHPVSRTVRRRCHLKGPGQGPGRMTCRKEGLKEGLKRGQKRELKRGQKRGQKRELKRSYPAAAFRRAGRPGVLPVVFLLVGLLATGAVGLLAPGSNTARAEGVPAGGSVSIVARGSGWDVTVTYHVRKVDISPVTFTGTAGSAVAGYPQPSVVGYNFQINNDLCGGRQDPLTGEYEYPNSGQATISIYFPPGTYSDPDLPGLMETTVIRRSSCGQDGPVHLVPKPQIEEEDIGDISISIWERIELPRLQITANPLTGLVTVPAWFWLTLTPTGNWWPGTDPAQGGQPFGVSVTIPLPSQTHTVQVLVDLTKLLWDFGDGNNSRRFFQTTLTGREYPRRSNVAHAYNNETTYHPQATLTFIPRYAWNGGTWTALPDQFRQGLAPGEYRVKEAQTVLTGPGGLPGQ